MQYFSHKSSKTECLKQNSTLNCATDFQSQWSRKISTRIAYKWQTFTLKLPKTSEEEEQWLREETWKAIEKRKMIHDKIHNTKSERRKSKLRLEYKMKDREVKRITRESFLTAKKNTNKRRHQVVAVKSKRSETIKGKNSRLKGLA